MELATALITAVAGLFSGGGAVVWYNSWIKSRNTDVDNDIKTSRLFIERLDKVEAKLEVQDKKIDRLSTENANLNASTKILIHRIDTLLTKLGEYEDIPEKKRTRYTNLPIFGDE